MILQEYKIYFINGRVIKCAEEESLSTEQKLPNRFRACKPDDLLIIGSKETSEAYIPARNILYISTGDRIGW